MLSRFAILILAVTTTGFNKEVDAQLQWKNHIGSQTRSAVTEKRPLIVVIEDSAKESVGDHNLAGKSKDVLSKQFELVKVDVRTNYGRRVAKAFGAKELPFTVVTNGDSGDIVFRKSGQMTDQDWDVALRNGAELQWSNRYHGAVNVATNGARKTKRPLVLVIENTNTRKSTFEDNLDSESKKYLVENQFELVKVDAKTKHGYKLAKTVGAGKLPLVLVTKSDASEVVFRRSGQMSKHDWKNALAKSFVPAERPSKRLSVAVVAKKQTKTKQAAEPSTASRAVKASKVATAETASVYTAAPVAVAEAVAVEVHPAIPVVTETLPMAESAPVFASNTVFHAPPASAFPAHQVVLAPPTVQPTYAASHAPSMAVPSSSGGFGGLCST